MTEMTETAILNRIKTAYRKILGDNLVGIYVHGSIAFGCFHWEKSDIDFVVVVNRPPALAEKEALLALLLEMDGCLPPKGVEMSVVLEEVCCPFVYPTPFELHFSNTHKECCQRDLEKYCQTMHGLDTDLAAHFTVIRQAGITLSGRNKDEVFGEVPPSAFIDSIREDVRQGEEAIDDDPVYVILNLCRVLAYLREGLVLSKEGGGTWGLKNLPAPYRPLIAHALGCYTGSCLFEADKDTAHAFARDMLYEILTNDNKID